MITNPLEVPRDAIFICGNISATSGTNNSDFSELERKLVEKGYSVINSARIKCQSITLTEEKERELITRMRMAYMAMCGVVITIDNWASCEEAKALVSAARQIGKPIVLDEMFDSYIRLKFLKKDHAA